MSDKTIPQQKAELLEARAKRAAATQEARDAQEVADLGAIAALEAEHGYELDTSMCVVRYVPGHPVIVGVRAPSELEYKRFFSQINRANGNADAKVAAQTMLAQSCWVYPDAAESRKAMLAANAALLASVGNLANKLAELASAEEGKG